MNIWQAINTESVFVFESLLSFFLIRICKVYDVSFGESSIHCYGISTVSLSKNISKGKGSFMESTLFHHSDIEALQHAHERVLFM